MRVRGRSRRAGSVGAALAALAVLIVVVASTGGAAASPPSASGGAAGASSAAPRRVLVITAPRLTWSEVQAARPKHLMRLFARSAVASNSVRTVGPITDPEEGYLTLGAGNRSAGTENGSGIVLDATDAIGPAGVAGAYLRITGRHPNAPIVTTMLPVVQTANADDHYGTIPGSLAGALGRLGVAAVGNAAEARGDQSHRDVALAAIDPTGRVRSGRVGDTLLLDDPASPFGLRLDNDAVVATVTAAFADSRVVFADLSDLERAERARASAFPDQAEAQFRTALERSDELVGRLLDRLDLRRDLVVVVAPTSPLSDEQLTVFSVAGPGFRAGWATSSTTRRSRYVTSTDLAPTLVAALGRRVPEAMTDVRITPEPTDRALADRIDTLVSDGLRATHRDQVFSPFTVAFIITLVAVLALTVWSLARAPAAAPVVRVGALWVLAVLPCSYLAGLLPLDAMSAGAHAAVVVLAALAIATASALVAVRRGGGWLLAPPIALVALLWVVLIIDTFTGSNLELDTIFGYSPIVAGRFAGVGNQAFSMMGLASVLLACELVGRARVRNGGTMPRREVAIVVGLFLVTLVADGHPAFGSDVGGVLALVPTYLLAAALFAGIRIRWRLVVGVTVATVVALAGFALVDLARPEADRTHLGRFAQQLVDGKAGEILQRKLIANLNVLSAVWTWVIPVALVFFVYLSWRPTRTMLALRRRYPGFRIFGTLGLVLGVLATAFNDSGVSMPAMMLAIALAYTAYLAIDLESVR